MRVRGERRRAVVGVLTLSLTLTVTVVGVLTLSLTLTVTVVGVLTLSLTLTLTATVVGVASSAAWSAVELHTPSRSTT